MRTPLKTRTVTLTQFAMLLAIEAVVCFTPLGSLPAIGPIVATLAMVPVIITAILLGTGAGAAMGAFAGLFSLLVWTFTPPSPLVAFVFTPFYTLGTTRGNVWSLVICF
ncbi:MAG: ECF transporter S component, partial [Caldiserica bacterium]|nr:ECF transporter S component [Caldisericota bacterium]